MSDEKDDILRQLFSSALNLLNKVLEPAACLSKNKVKRYFFSRIW